MRKSQIKDEVAKLKLENASLHGSIRRYQTRLAVLHDEITKLENREQEWQDEVMMWKDKYVDVTSKDDVVYMDFD